MFICLWEWKKLGMRWRAGEGCRIAGADVFELVRGTPENPCCSLLFAEALEA